MRILIESHRYPAELVDGIIAGLTNLRNIHGEVSINHVGYYYNPILKDAVFILPKVLLDGSSDESSKDDLLFGKYKPEEVINLKEQKLLSKEEYDFLYGLSVWIYRALMVYRDSHPDGEIVEQRYVQQMSRGRIHQCNTYLDILLALLEFNRKNQDFFFFILRNIHSGYNKINWTKTITHTQAIIQEGSPIYVSPVNRKKQVNFDEELLIIYFSILNHLHEKYGFPVSINVNYELITGNQFEKYIDGIGKRRLLAIKYKYYSDTALYLWELCYSFFDQSHNVAIETNNQEYILVKNFNLVFEAIIDELIGTDHRELPPHLAEQGDGKLVDHLWIDDIILPSKDSTPVYYIGDSKYYKHSTPIDEKSRYKQFTYARNVIQWSYDALMGRTKCDDEKYKIRLRDERTEGYNVIPNFFISSKVNFEDLNYNDDGLKLHNGSDKLEPTDQFPNRLFDRDTLIISHYDVNFLFVLAMYARNDSTKKRVWRDEVRKKFKEHVQKVLDQKYSFFALKGFNKAESERYIDTHFKELIGKIYRTEGEEDIYTFAVEKKVDGTIDKNTLNELAKYFYIAECDIKESENPHERIEQEIAQRGEMLGGKAIVVDDNKCTETAERIRVQHKYAIGLADKPGSLSLAEGFLNAHYLILHKLSNPIVFRLKPGPKLISKNQLGEIPFKMKDESIEIYLLFEIEEEDSNIANQISQHLLNHPPEDYDRRQSYVTDISFLIQPEYDNS